MNKSKILIGFIICVTIYMGILLIAFRKQIFGKEEKIDIYMVLDNQKNYLYSDGEYTEISDTEIEKLDKTFDTYVNYDDYGNYKLKMGSVWNLFDEKDDFKMHEGYLFAVSDSKKANVETSRPRSLTDEEKNMLKDDYEVSNLNNLMVEQVFDTDLDNDDKIDKLICVSYHEIGEDTKNYYNLVIAIIADKKYNIIKEKGSKLDNIYMIKAIFRIDEESHQSFVLEKITNPEGDIESYDVNDAIYRFNDGKYQAVLERE